MKELSELIFMVSHVPLKACRVLASEMEFKRLKNSTVAVQETILPLGEIQYVFTPFKFY